MKSIVLYTARTDNSGKRHPAGATLQVGSAKAQVSAESAKAWVEAGMARDRGKSETEAAPKPARKRRAASTRKKVTAVKSTSETPPAPE